MLEQGVQDIHEGRIPATIYSDGDPLALERERVLQLTAMSAGGWATWSGDAEALSKREHCYPPELLAQAWAYLVRQLDA